MARKTILLVEDDESLNRGISLKLGKEGYQVLSAYRIKEADRLWKNNEIQMVISDIMLPDGSGLEFGKRIRGESQIYLVYLTAMDQEVDMINGYDTGADDYITKPFSVAILTSKINALMRRIDDPSASFICSGEFEVSLRELSVKKKGDPVFLSKTELRLFLCLLENAGRIVTKEAILEKVWGIDGGFIDDNTVMVNISRLKGKLGTDKISNVRGLGYIWTGEVFRN